MNRFLVPTILASIIAVAGVFAFMPVEQISTVHDTLSSQTNVGNEFAGQDRAVTVSANFSHGLVEQVIVIPGASSVTLTGFGIVSSIPNNGSSVVGSIDQNCYLQSTAAGATVSNGFRLVNTTTGSTNSTTIDSTNMPAGHGIVLGQSNSSGATGVCTATIVLESWDD